MAALRRLTLRDFVIVDELEVELNEGFTVLTGETGAGKSILIDALQLALGNRADASVVREGCTKADITAEFDLVPAQHGALAAWLEASGLEANEPDATLMLRRVIDAQGKSRAWVNGRPATVTQLRELAPWLVDIHGQHAWQSLTRPDAVRELLDAYAGIDTGPAARAWAQWRQRKKALDEATKKQHTLQQESERLSWQIAEVDKLAPQVDEWDELNSQHTRLSNAQALMDAAQAAIQALEDDDSGALRLLAKAQDALQDQTDVEPEFTALVAMMFATVAFSIDAMLPALPEIARELSPDAPNAAQLILTSFVMGMGIGTLFTGPLSDSYGRKRVIIFGAVLYSLGALLAYLAPTLETVLAARMIQGLGAAAPRIATDTSIPANASASAGS